MLHPETLLYLGTLDDRPYVTCEVDQEFPLPPGWQELTPRAGLGQLDDQVSTLVGYASQLLLWQRTSRYCPVCAHSTEPIADTWGKHCPNCGYQRYPTVTPAILVLVHDGERMLLAHKPGWGKRYSLIAGFVEPGESLEGCVMREVYEEVGVAITDIAYVGSQPWPFPHQVMVGYTARYVSGAIRLDERELDGAAWFRPDALPELPPPHSLAHHIIMTWVTAQQIK